jgi:hypothetical protein
MRQLTKRSPTPRRWCQSLINRRSLTMTYPYTSQTGLACEALPRIIWHWLSGCWYHCHDPLLQTLTLNAPHLPVPRPGRYLEVATWTPTLRYLDTHSKRLIRSLPGHPLYATWTPTLRDSLRYLDTHSKRLITLPGYATWTPTLRDSSFLAIRSVGMGWDGCPGSRGSRSNTICWDGCPGSRY